MHEKHEKQRGREKERECMCAERDSRRRLSTSFVCTSEIQATLSLLAAESAFLPSLPPSLPPSRHVHVYEIHVCVCRDNGHPKTGRLVAIAALDSTNITVPSLTRRAIGPKNRPNDPPSGGRRGEEGEQATRSRRRRY